MPGRIKASSNSQSASPRPSPSRLHGETTSILRQPLLQSLPRCGGLPAHPPSPLPHPQAKLLGLLRVREGVQPGASSGVCHKASNTSWKPKPQSWRAAEPRAEEVHVLHTHSSISCRQTHYNRASNRPGSMVTTSQTFPHQSSKQPCEAGASVILILRLKKLRQVMVKELAWGPTASG